MNMNQMMLAMQAKKAWEKFCANHPKFQPFLKAVSTGGISENMIISIEVKNADGRTYQTNMRISAEDMELFEMLKGMKG